MVSTALMGFTPTSAHENPSFNHLSLKTHQVISPLLKEGAEKNYCKDKEQSVKPPPPAWLFMATMTIITIHHVVISLFHAPIKARTMVIMRLVITI